MTSRRVRVLGSKHHCGVLGIVMAPRRSGRPFPPRARGIKTSGMAQVQEHPPTNNIQKEFTTIFNQDETKHADFSSLVSV